MAKNKTIRVNFSVGKKKMNVVLSGGRAKLTFPGSETDTKTVDMLVFEFKMFARQFLKEYGANDKEIFKEMGLEIE